MTSTVRYQVAAYAGTIEVHNVDENDETDYVIARAKRDLTRKSGGSLPVGVQCFKEVERRRCSRQIGPRQGVRSY
jgi:hypothetical protein